MARTCRVQLAMSRAEVFALEAVRASFGDVSQADAVVRLLRAECARNDDREDCVTALHLLEADPARSKGGRPPTKPKTPPGVGSQEDGAQMLA